MAIRSDSPTVDTARVLSFNSASNRDSTACRSDPVSVVPDEVLDTDIEAYRIPAADRLAIDYIITKECKEDPSLASDSRSNRAVPTNIRAVLHGSCYYEPNAGAVFDNIIQHITIKWDYVGGGHGSSNRDCESRDLPTVYRRPIGYD